MAQGHIGLKPPNLNKIISSIPLLNKAYFVRKLAGGPTSRSWLLNLNDGPVVLRADKPLANILGLDRLAELDVLTGVSQTGFAPKVLWADPDRGLLVTRYISGNPWKKADASSMLNVERLARRMREVHETKIHAPLMDIEETAQRYAKLAGTLESLDLLAQTKAVLKLARNDLTEYAFCHNDVGYRNVIDTGTIWLLDWEYAAVGMVWFDLAGALLQNHYSRRQVQDFAEAYCGAFDEVIEQRLKLFSHLYVLISALWYQVVCSVSCNMANQAQLLRLMRLIHNHEQ